MNKRGPEEALVTGMAIGHWRASVHRHPKGSRGTESHDCSVDSQPHENPGVVNSVSEDDVGDMKRLPNHVSPAQQLFRLHILELGM